jgi:hypothetical protein
MTIDNLTGAQLFVLASLPEELQEAFRANTPGAVQYFEMLEVNLRRYSYRGLSARELMGAALSRTGMDIEELASVHELGSEFLSAGGILPMAEKVGTEWEAEQAERSKKTGGGG